MKKFVILLLLVSQISYADCDWSKITKGSDGNYIYTKELHICVGESVEENKNLKKSIELKDLAIQKQEDRITLWRDTTEKLEDRVNKIDDMQSKNQLLYIGLGVLGTLAASWGASQLIRR